VESQVEARFADLKRKEHSAWNACYAELLALARIVINGRAAWISEPVKEEIENESVKALRNGPQKSDSKLS